MTLGFIFYYLKLFYQYSSPNLIQYISHQSACICPNTSGTSRHSQSQCSSRFAICIFHLSTYIFLICSSNKNLFCRCMLHMPMILICTNLPVGSNQKRTLSIALDRVGYSFDKMERKEQLQQLGIDPQVKSNHYSKMYNNQFYHHNPDTQDRLASKFPRIRNIFSCN